MHAPVDCSPTEEVHQGWEQGSVNTLFPPSSSSYVGTGFIGGEDQGYIACP